MTFLELLRQSEAIFSSVKLPQGWNLSLEDGPERVSIVVSNGVIKLNFGEAEKRDFWPTPSEPSYDIAYRNLDRIVNGPNGATFKMLLADRIAWAEGDVIVRRARMERDAEAEELIRQQKLRDDAARAALESLREQQEREAEEERAREADRQRQIAAQKAAERAEKQRKAFEQEKKLKDAIKKPADVIETKGNPMNIQDEILYGKPLVPLEGTQDDMGGRDFPPEAFDPIPSPAFQDKPLTKPLPVDTTESVSGTTGAISLGPLLILGVTGFVAWLIWG